MYNGAWDYPANVRGYTYGLGIIKGINVTLDFQEVVHPAYNRDRGPVSIGSLRVHFEF
jgi:high affinity Mn2+ porin